MKNHESVQMTFVCASCRETKVAREFEIQPLPHGFIRSDTCKVCCRVIESRRSRRPIRHESPTVRTAESPAPQTINVVSANERLPLAA